MELRLGRGEHRPRASTGSMTSKFLPPSKKGAGPGSHLSAVSALLLKNWTLCEWCGGRVRPCHGKVRQAREGEEWIGGFRFLSP